MPTPEQLRLAMEQKAESGYPAYTTKQLADRVIAEDSFLGKKIQRAMQLGVSREQALNFYGYGSAMGKPPEPKKAGFFERLAQDVQQRSANLGQSIERQQMGQQGLGSTILQGAGEAFGLAFGDVPGEVIQSGINMTPNAIKQPIMGAAGAALQTKPGQAIAQGVQGVADAYGDFKQENPVVAENIESVANIGMSLPVGAIAGKSVQAAGKAGRAIASARAASKTAAAAGKLDNVIADGIEKGIRISTTGKRSIGDLEQFKSQASEAVKAIIRKQDALKLTDEFGQEAAEKLPQNLRQFSEAVDQTKKAIFEEYDQLARRAGEAGAEVDLSSVASELIDTVSDPKFASLEDQAPEIADYILKRTAALEKRGFYTAEQAQQAIKNYNLSLDSFYKNPNYENYATASIDAMIANNLRSAVDDVIGKATGGNYQALKNQYGALRAIEKDVLNRAIVDARKNTKGLLDFTDIFTGGDLIAGLATMNPALLAKAGAQKGIKEYFKFLNDPNRIVRSMFRKADALMKALPTE